MNGTLAAGLALGCAKAEQCLNEALRYNPNSAATLAGLKGKSIRITCTMPPCELMLGFRDDGVYVIPCSETDFGENDLRENDLRENDLRENKANSNHPADTDARLSGHLSALLLLLFDGENISPDYWHSYQGSVTPEGDRGLITALLKLFEASQIDRQAWLASIIGDVPAHLIGQSLLQLHQHGNHLKRHGNEAAENFLRDEWRANPFFRSAQRMGESLTAGNGGEVFKRDVMREVEKLRSRLERIFA